MTGYWINPNVLMQEYFDLVKEYNDFYTDDPNKWDIPKLDKLRFDCLKPHGNPVHVLDVGCANGHTLNYLSRYWPDATYTGIDLSSVAVEAARKNMPSGKFVCGNIENCDLGKFDTILLCGTAEHFYDPLEGLQAVFNQLADNGIVYLEIPNCLAYTRSEGKEGYLRVNQGSRQMEWHYRRETWEKVIGEAGFAIVESIVGPQQYNEFIWILAKAEA